MSQKLNLALLMEIFEITKNHTDKGIARILSLVESPVARIQLVVIKAQRCMIEGEILTPDEVMLLLDSSDVN